MWTDYDSVMTETDEELRNPETRKERVQALFQKWWEKAWYMLHSIRGTSGSVLPSYAMLHFHESRLREDQIALLERGMSPWLEDDK